MMQQQKNMICKLGSQDIMPTGSWYLARIALISNLGILKLGAELKNQM